MHPHPHMTSMHPPPHVILNQSKLQEGPLSFSLFLSLTLLVRVDTLRTHYLQLCRIHTTSHHTTMSHTTTPHQESWHPAHLYLRRPLRPFHGNYLSPYNYVSYNHVVRWDLRRAVTPPPPQQPNLFKVGLFLPHCPPPHTPTLYSLAGSLKYWVSSRVRSVTWHKFSKVKSNHNTKLN